tara:strand:- start:64 stop:552 length:489 start_codon:yes stop_codon:yes gene_type:complete
MALTKINNNTLSAVTTLPSAIATGDVLQVLNATDSTSRSTTTSGSFVTASNTLSINITPSSTSSKIFVTMNSNGYSNTAGKNVYFTLYRDSTNLGHSVDGLINWWDETNRQIGNGFSMSYLDSPSSTSQLTYQVYMRIESGTTGFMNYNRTQGSITAFEIAG